MRSPLDTPNRLVDADDVDAVEVLEIEQIGIARDDQISGAGQGAGER